MMWFILVYALRYTGKTHKKKGLCMKTLRAEDKIATSHKYKSEKKIFKFVKQYDGIMELISSIENE